MTMGMSDNGRELIERCMDKLNDHDLALVPRAAKELMERRTEEALRKIARADAEVQRAKIEHERLLEKFKGHL